MTRATVPDDTSFPLAVRRVSAGMTIVADPHRTASDEVFPTASASATTVGASALPQRLLEQVRSATSLDAAATALHQVADRLRLPALSKRGEELLGHPVHPALTDLPIGFWTSSFLLDFFGGPHQAVASRRLIAAGVLSAVPTVAFGLGDLPEDGQERRVATVHAASNLAAIACYAGSWRARRREHWVRGVGLAMIGATVATLGGYLGGALAFAGPVGDEQD